eukprot:TRINITY_DN20246_c0_g1_i1.p1 TRINITY_DN20246_c0_g1~~TRINITY_DN20246_c0_g1_i1.p1  ORF type:complete len:323 (+),score=62.48 TRINITY_DN20246_c0_g1_i1:53-1021(+)
MNHRGLVQKKAYYQLWEGQYAQVYIGKMCALCLDMDETNWVPGLVIAYDQNDVWIRYKYLACHGWYWRKTKQPRYWVKCFGRASVFWKLGYLPEYPLQKTFVESHHKFCTHAKQEMIKAAKAQDDELTFSLGEMADLASIKRKITKLKKLNRASSKWDRRIPAKQRARYYRKAAQKRTADPNRTIQLQSPGETNSRRKRQQKVAVNVSVFDENWTVLATKTDRRKERKQQSEDFDCRAWVKEMVYDQDDERIEREQIQRQYLAEDEASSNTAVYDLMGIAPSQLQCYYSEQPKQHVADDVKSLYGDCVLLHFSLSPVTTAAS